MQKSAKSTCAPADSCKENIRNPSKTRRASKQIKSITYEIFKDIGDLAK